MPTVRYQLTKSEAVLTALRRRMLRRPFIVVEAGLLVTTLLVWFWGAEYRYLGIWFGALFVFLPVFTLIVLLKTVQNIPILTSETTLSFDASGITLSTAGLTSQLAWSTYRRWSESSEHFFLYLGESVATTIPKRAFTPEDADLFRTYAKAIETSSAKA